MDCQRQSPRLLPPQQTGNPPTHPPTHPSTQTHPLYLSIPLPRFLPQNVAIIGYARSKMSDDDLRTKLRPYMKGTPDRIDAFLGSCSYVAGSYTEAKDWQVLNSRLRQREAACPDSPFGRLYYLALPPSV